MPMPTPLDLLPAVIAAAEAAGALIATEFARPGGPRGGGDKAVVDTEAEILIREALLPLGPARFYGEETGVHGDRASGFVWVVDPNDGTRAFLEGRRGSAVSIALLVEGRPVLGVVHAPLTPDRGPDTIAWAEGVPHILRNGAPVTARLADAPLKLGTIVLLDHRSGDRPDAHGRFVAPARFVALPSIAYRLARVAAGDAVATASTGGPCALDYAAGHALVLAAGGVLLDEAGRPVTYGRDGRGAVSACFGGGPDAVRTLLARPWTDLRKAPVLPARLPVPLPAPRPQRLPEGTRLDRAVGCLLGQVIGDSLGSLVEFQTAARIARSHPGGVRDLADGGTWNTLAGQPTDDSELALALARSLARQGGFDREDVAEAYGRWYRSGPFDIGGTTRAALGPAAAAPPGHRAEAAMGAASRSTPSNGSLMRVAPIGIAARDPAEAARWAAEDSRLSHAHPDCVAACAAFAAAIATGVAGGSRTDMAAAARDHVPAGATSVLRALDAAEAGKAPADFERQMGWVLIAFQNAFRHLLHTPDVEHALVETVSAGGDTDTNGAIAGALLGAAVERRAWPARWTLAVLACRPSQGIGAPNPRPPEYWPDDVPELADILAGIGAGPAMTDSATDA